MLRATHRQINQFLEVLFLGEKRIPVSESRRRLVHTVSEALGRPGLVRQIHFGGLMDF